MKRASGPEPLQLNAGETPSREVPRLDFAIAVWGAVYVDTMLSLAIPSFLAPGNIPACASVTSVQFTIVTRPEDIDRIKSHSVIRELERFTTLSLVPLLTEDKFDGANRYDVMALCHRHVLANSSQDGSVISILSPDCVISDGTLSFGLQRILDGHPAVLVAGPRGSLDSIVGRLETFRRGGEAALAIPPRDLVSLATRFPHAISQLLYWDAEPFSMFPSAIYWRVLPDSFLAKYFHLHPLFVDLAVAASEVSNSGTIDGTLLGLARIDPADIFVSTQSDDMCVIELSRDDHDPMGSLPHVVRNKAIFVGRWAIYATDQNHRRQFLAYSFRFQGREPVDWRAIETKAESNIRFLGIWLRLIDRLPFEGRVDRLDRLVRSRVRRVRDRIRAVVRRFPPGVPPISGFGKLLTRLLTPGPAAAGLSVGWFAVTKGARALVRLGEVYGKLRATQIDSRWLSRWANRSPSMPQYIRDHMQNYFTIRVLPGRARSPGLFGALAYRVLRYGRVVFVVNIAPGTGHNTVELDYFLRLRGAGELDPTSRYVLLRLPNEFHSDTISLYKQHFWLASKSRFLFNLIMPVVAGHPELRIDCGLSRLKWHLRGDGSFTLPPQGQSFLYQISKAENREAWKTYFRLRERTKHLHPLKDGLSIDPELLDFLGGNADRLVLTHIKSHVANATAAPSDPPSYLLAIEALKRQGFRLVHVGREAMPPAFAAAGVLNYAESSVASYRHDLQLFALARLAITAGSGIALIPDCMGIPLVYIDSWHIGMPMASSDCVIVPALMIDRSTGRSLRFRDQLKLYFDLEDRGDEVFPENRYFARNASADEVEAAVQEALDGSFRAVPLTALQQAFRYLDPDGVGPLSESRVSEYFLGKHRDLVEDSEMQLANPK
jgi:putative glycosyltransferase (TIGR04372 family)